MNTRQLLTFPARNLVFVIPVMLISGLITGYYVDTTPLKTVILPVSILMVYPAMIGFRLGELTKFTEMRLMGVNLVVNFLVLPLIAVFIGKLFLHNHPDLFTGLVIISVVPGGNMVVAFTMMFKGNLSASLKLSATNLLLGSFLVPLYLYVLVGKLVPINVVQVFQTITMVVFLPLVMGILTYKLLMKRYSEETFQKEIKPLLPGLSSWGLVYIIFTSISLKSRMIFGYPGLLLQAIGGLFLFYFLVFFVVVIIARLFFNRRDGMTLFLNSILRNLAISIGLAITAFNSQTAMMVALAFLFQQQIAVWFWKLDNRFHLLVEN